MDFLILLNSQTLIRSNSTFSYWAGLLGEGKVFSPNVKGKIGLNKVNFVDNNWEGTFDQKYHEGCPYVYDNLFIED